MPKKEISDWKIPLYKIYTDEEDYTQISKIIKRGNNWAIGPEIEEFENAIKNYSFFDFLNLILVLENLLGMVL